VVTAVFRVLFGKGDFPNFGNGLELALKVISRSSPSPTTKIGAGRHVQPTGTPRAVGHFLVLLLAPLRYGEIPAAEAGSLSDATGPNRMRIPDGKRRKPSRATPLAQMKEAREGGLDALMRRRRKDRGQPAAAPGRHDRQGDSP